MSQMGQSAPRDERSWSTLSSPGNWLFLVFLVVALVFVALSVGCAAPTTGSEAIDNAIVGQIEKRGFFDKLLSFVAEILLPVAVGVVVFVLSDGVGTFLQAILGAGATAMTGQAMKDDPGPTSVTKNDIHLTAEKGSHVTVDASNPLAATTAASEPLMQTIEHYGFYILIIALVWRNRRHFVDILTGQAKGRIIKTLWHCVWGGDDPSTEVVEKD